MYLLSDRDAPTRFFYHHPLIKPNYANQSLREEFVSDIKEKKPKLIIDMVPWISLPWTVTRVTIGLEDHRYIA